MARLLRFNTSTGLVLQYNTSGNTIKRIGHEDTIINPDLTATTSKDFRDWRVLDIRKDSNGQGLGTVREMTATEKGIRDARVKSDEKANAAAGNLDPVLAVKSLYKVLKAANPALANSWLTQYKKDAGIN